MNVDVAFTNIKVIPKKIRNYKLFSEYLIKSFPYENIEFFLEWCDSYNVDFDTFIFIIKYLSFVYIS